MCDTKKKTIAGGVYPTMITPYRNGRIDYEAVDALVEWYIKEGCTGIFAVCQSSEMGFLSFDERVTLAKRVVKAAAGRIPVVASGHISDSMDEQIRETNAIAEVGVDAFVAVSNRFDLHNDGDDVWIKNAEAFLQGIDPAIPLGVYECPRPYKRLLTPKILDFCISTGRFVFIKDTCCRPELLSARLEQLKGTGIGLFNANEQTLLFSLEHGAAGYSGIMANFHPDLLAWLYGHFRTEPEKAAKVSAMLSMEAFTEAATYPCTAKAYLARFAGIPMETFARSADEKSYTPYWELIGEQMHLFHETVRGVIC